MKSARRERTPEQKKRDYARQRAWTLANKDHVKDYMRTYAAEHREELKTYRAARYRAKHLETKQQHASYREANREKILAWQRHHREVNRDKINAALRAKRQANLEAARERERVLRRLNPEKKRERDAEYRRRHPETYRASIERAKKAKPEHYKLIQRDSHARRRARKAQVTVEAVKARDIIRRDRGVCRLCRLPVDAGQVSLDHLIPILRQGPHVEWNLALAHLRCNQQRGTRRVLQSETKEGALAYLSRLGQRVAA